MLKQEKASALLFAIIALLVIAIIAVGSYLILSDYSASSSGSSSDSPSESSSSTSLFSKSIKNEVVTADNYVEISNKIGEELKDTDEPYQFLYACTYYIMTDGMASILDPNADENASYARIYGKTVGQLINEGKQLMVDNNTTVEQFKQSIEDSANDYNI